MLLALTFSFIPLQYVYAVPLTLESGINGNVYTVEGAPGTAGTKGVDYDIGTYLAGGDGGKGHGFKDQYNFHGGHFCSAAETNCFVSGPPIFTDAGGLEGPDHNWLQGTNHAIVVDLGDGNQSDQAIVFNSIDHLGVGVTYGDAEKDFWNGFVEGIEFTVYGTNNLTDALSCGSASGGFGSAETGTVPASGPCSSFEQATLDYVFIDGWADFNATKEGDDFASVWQLSAPMRYIAVYSHFTDPIVDDGFQSDDNELDAIGRFLKEIGEPCPNCPRPPAVGGEILGIDMTSLLVAGAFSNVTWIIPIAGVTAAGIIGYIVTSRRK
jgi:hypothetical protein